MTAVVVTSVGMFVAGFPGAFVGLLAAAGWDRWRRRRRPHPVVDPVEAATVALVLVGAGWPPINAIAGAAAGDPEVAAVARRARRLGAAAALASADGPLAPLLRRLADAAVSGAPAQPAIRAYIETEHRRRHVSAVERARRLPVRMMVPMALLVLPGFVLMVYGPALLGLVADLVGPLAG